MIGLEVGGPRFREAPTHSYALALPAFVQPDYPGRPHRRGKHDWRIVCGRLRQLREEDERVFPRDELSELPAYGRLALPVAEHAPKHELRKLAGGCAHEGAGGRFRRRLTG